MTSYQFGVTSKVLNDGKTYYYVTIDGRVPSSPVRYHTRAAADRNAKRRQIRFDSRLI